MKNFNTIYGSIIVAEVGSDGIVVSSDSRAMIKQNNQPHSYFDGTAKITQIRSLIFGAVGVGSVGGKGILTIAKKIALTPTWPGDMQGFVRLFGQSVKRNFSLSEIELLKQSEFVLAGYSNGKPTIFKFTLEDLETNTVWPAPQYYVTQGPAFPFLNYDPKLDCAKLAELAEDGIKEFAKKFEMDYFIGGPISSAQIKPSRAITWLKNQFDDKVDQNIDALIAQGKIKTTLIDLKQVALSDSLIKAYLKINP
ncbi:MAG: hypothetical protein JST19_05565 [Bacteroidetes bacterium]|nr:hypothetical protein [Bacteroidota bacterium]